MLKDTPQGQTNHCPMCEDAAKRIEELERHNAQMIQLLKDGAEPSATQEKADDGMCAQWDVDALAVINSTSAQSSAWLNKKHVEWIGRPIAEVKDIEIVWLRKFGDGYLYAIPSLTEKGDE